MTEPSKTPRLEGLTTARRLLLRSALEARAAGQEDISKDLDGLAAQVGLIQMRVDWRAAAAEVLRP